jgi:hypothetical protein
MKKIFLLLLTALLLLSALIHAAQVQNLTIYFDKDKALIDSEQLVKLQILKQADVVMLKGHTDADGSDQYNIALSKKRVEEIKTAIKKLDPEIKIESGYYGESKPLNNNAGDLAKQQNRRVEISWISDPMLRVKDPSQFFEIDACKDNILTCREGTKIEIPAGAFSDKRVLVKVNEYYNAASIFASNLSTRSDSKPIESAGMVYISAEVEGQKVDPALPLKIKFPRNNKNQDFKIFTGERSSNFEMNWQLKGTTPKVLWDSSKPAEPIMAGDPQQWQQVTDGFSCSTTVTGDVYDQIPKNFWYKLNDAKTQNDFRVGGCVEMAPIDITVSKEGLITEIKRNFSRRDSLCERPLQNFIRACLPERFKPLKWQSTIHIAFNKYSYTQQAPRALGWINGFGDEFSADYETDKIVLNTTQLGWINCDRFIQSRWTDYTVETKPDANVRLLLKKYKSFFINEYWNSNKDATMEAQKAGKYIFRSVPADEEALIVCTRKVNGKILLAMADAKTVTRGTFSNLTYKEVTQKELEEALKALKI